MANNAQNSAQENVIGSDLETTKLNKNLKKNAPQFDNQEWLEKQNPMDFITPDNSSSKFDSAREIEVQKGLELLEKTPIEGTILNPLVILLGKYWECKPARASIKKMIDAEAEAKGIDSVTYLQVVLDKEIEKVSQVQNAIDRVRYAKTYFKPRVSATKIPTKLVQIDGATYVVPIAQLEQAKIDFVGDKEKIKAAVLSFSTLQNNLIEEL